eukprot:1160839-Pelagomonas_calceolata.AAC.2
MKRNCASKYPSAYNVPSVGSQIVPFTSFQDVSKGLLGAGLASMDIGSAGRLALQNLQIPEHSTNITLPKYSFPRPFPQANKQRLTSSRPDAILVVPRKRVPRTNARYPLRSKGG